MLKTGHYPISKITIFVILVISFVLLYFYRWTGDLRHYIIDGDGKDFYSYLPSIFIYKDLAHESILNSYIIPTPTGNVHAHTVGTALLLMPFFFIGYAWAYFSHAALDGVSAPFQIMVSLGGLFYLVTGLVYLRRLLIAFSHKDKIIAAVLILIFFGTNLLVYALLDSSMSHLYSFVLITVFLYYTHKAFQQLSQKYLCFSFLLLGLIILVRPVNAIIVLAIPFFTDSFRDLISKIKYFLQNKISLILPLLSFLTPLSLQCIIWYIQNGKILQWTNRGYGFYFNHPHTGLMLFGFTSGFFIYTPLCLVTLFGFIPLFTRNKFKFIILLFFIAFSFYFFSCYSTYTYPDGLGIRTLVDFYALFSILLSILLTHIPRKKIKYAVFIIIFCSFLLNLIYCYQFQSNILPTAGMNFKKYKYIFLKTNKSYANVLGGASELPPYSTEVHKIIYTYNYNDSLLFNNTEYGLTTTVPLNFPFDELYLKIHLKRKEDACNSSFNAFIVAQVTSEKGDLKGYEIHRLNDVPSQNCCTWEDLHYEIRLFDLATLSTDKLSIYIWNRSKQNFSISNYSIEVYGYTY